MLQNGARSVRVPVRLVLKRRTHKESTSPSMAASPVNSLNAHTCGPVTVTILDDRSHSHTRPKHRYYSRVALARASLSLKRPSHSRLRSTQKSVRSVRVTARFVYQRKTQKDSSPPSKPVASLEPISQRSQHRSAHACGPVCDRCITHDTSKAHLPNAVRSLSFLHSLDAVRSLSLS